MLLVGTSMPLTGQVTGQAIGVAQEFRVADTRCPPGTCVCSGQLREGNARPSTIHGECVAADFDGDGTTDFAMSYGEGWAFLVLRNTDGEQEAVLFDAGGVLELYPPRSTVGPHGEPSSTNHGLFVPYFFGTDHAVFLWDGKALQRTLLPAWADAAPTAAPMPQWAFDSSATVPDERAIVHGIRLGMAEDEVRAKFGEPTRVREDWGPVLDSTRTLEFPGATALLSRNGVEDFDCWGGRECHLPGGPGIGVALAEVVEALGPGERSDGVPRLLRYHVEGCDCWIDIQFDGRLRVRLISLTFDRS
jgi:hypothetical protein